MAIEFLTSYALQFALGGDYYDKVVAHTALDGFWLLNEMLTTTGPRDSEGSNDGTFTGGMTLGSMGPFPHGGTAMLLNGSSGYANIGDVATFEYSGAFSVEFMFKTTSAAAAVMGLVGK